MEVFVTPQQQVELRIVQVRIHLSIDTSVQPPQIPTPVERVRSLSNHKHTKWVSVCRVCFSQMWSSFWWELAVEHYQFPWRWPLLLWEWVRRTSRPPVVSCGAGGKSSGWGLMNRLLDLRLGVQVHCALYECNTFWRSRQVDLPAQNTGLIQHLIF